jgi:hypothetical protein
MIPMFRQRFRGVVRATVNLSSASQARRKNYVGPKNLKSSGLPPKKLFLYHR